MPTYQFSGDGTCLTIFNSYAYPKASFQKVLNQIKAIHGDKKIFQRSDFSLKMEWTCHNFLYMLHIERDRTKDVDLDIPADHPEWMYQILGMLVWPGIR